MFFCASAVIAKTKHTTKKQLTFWFSEQNNPQSKCKTDVSIGMSPQQLSADCGVVPRGPCAAGGLFLA